jgi:hypothetical protein
VLGLDQRKPTQGLPAPGERQALPATTNTWEASYGDTLASAPTFGKGGKDVN